MTQAEYKQIAREEAAEVVKAAHQKRKRLDSLARQKGMTETDRRTGLAEFRRVLAGHLQDDAQFGPYA